MNEKKYAILEALKTDGARKVTTAEYNRALSLGDMVGETGADNSEIYRYNNEYYVEAVMGSWNYEAFSSLDEIKRKYGYVLMPDKYDPENRSLWYDF